MHLRGPAAMKGGLTGKGLDKTTIRSQDDHMKYSSVSYLKAHLSAELKAVQAGETVVVMDRDHPVARLAPLEDEKGIEVREPLRAFAFEQPVPIVSGGSLAPLFEDRGRR
jgi:antitoxin (DNA-binding transcriptional repressor) of toxin-antitoxin stability system